MDSLKLKSPVPKRNVISAPHSKFPVAINDERYSLNKLPEKFNGVFNGFTVIIDEENEMDKLYTMGCFGKGSLSRGYPLTVKNDSSQNSDSIVQQNQLQTKNLHIASNSDNLVDLSNLSNNMNIVNTAEPILQDKSLICKEKLNLFLEESFFLSYAIGCLNIYYHDKLLSLNEAWKLFQKAQSNFIDRYIGYHYFRAKGWVVKSGTKYGSDFLLYKQGPSFYHASYMVLMKNALDSMCSKRTDWKHLLALNRVSETANKRVIICEILRPVDFEKDNINQLRRCKVSEFFLDRWVTSENREIKY